MTPPRVMWRARSLVGVAFTPNALVAGKIYLNFIAGNVMVWQRGTWHTGYVGEVS